MITFVFESFHSLKSNPNQINFLLILIFTDLIEKSKAELSGVFGVLGEASKDAAVAIGEDFIGLLFRAFDRNRDGFIDRTEFVSPSSFLSFF
jgi:hypothetical protein